MIRSDREQARRITAYVDDGVLRRRAAAGGADMLSPQDRELAQLKELVHCLSDLEIAPPDGFQAALAAEIAETPSEPQPVRRGTRPLQAALAAAAVFLGIVVLVRSVVDVPVLSAQSVLSRSDAALTALVRPGQLLYRQWKVTSSSARGAPAQARSERVIEEWMDGGNFDRVAGRWYSKDGELQIAYATQREGEGYRPTVYFSPGVYDEPRGLLNIEPTRQEFDAALAQFPEAVQRGLRVYLDRNYIYAPITGERNFNRAIVESPARNIPEMPRILVSFHESHILGGTPVYCVRIVDSAAVTFNWRSSGPSVIRLAQAEILRYIARDSFLSVRTEERWVFEDGRQRLTTRELMSTRAVEAGDLASAAVVFVVPRGTPAHRQSALAHLTGVAGALARVPAFTRQRESDPALQSAPHTDLLQVGVVLRSSPRH